MTASQTTGNAPASVRELPTALGGYLLRGLGDEKRAILAEVLEGRVERTRLAKEMNRIERAMPATIAGQRSWTGADIRAVRLALGMTAQECADLVGVHRNTWESWEFGRTKPRQPRSRLGMEAFMRVAAKGLKR